MPNTYQAARKKTSLATFKRKHTNETFIVCGCGHSLKNFTPSDSVITIGVNDVERQFTPDYLVVLNSKNQFKGERFRFVEKSRAKALFTQLNLPVSHGNIVSIKLGKRGGTDCFDSNGLPFTRNSPYVALCLAIYMGAKRIGLIGVDFTEHHFYGNTGKHPLNSTLNTINAEYQNLFAAANALGIEIINLSIRSRIAAFPKSTLDQFLSEIHDIESELPSKFLSSGYKSGLAFESSANRPNEKPLNIVSYSTSPVAGVPEVLSRCINHDTVHNCRCVWANNEYGNGVVFKRDVEWIRSPNDAINLIKNADLVIVHNGKVAPQHMRIMRNKAIVTMAHNYLWNVDQTFVKSGYPGVVVGQYQASLEEFKSWLLVPNPMPFWDESYTQKRSKNNKITICYTPSAKHDCYPKNHRLYWHSKGYASTMKILQRLAAQYPIELEVIRNKQLSLNQVIAMKKRSHIVIDECVTGSYHRNSLEGLACGCVVVNGVGTDPAIEQVLYRCFDKDVESELKPFVGCSINELQSVLESLIKKGIQSLIDQGNKNSDWVQKNWNFSEQWHKFWRIPVANALDKNLTDSQSPSSHNTHYNVTNSHRIDSKRPRQLSTHKSENKRGSEGILHGDKISLYWTCRAKSNGNFGDMLSPVINKAFAGKDSVFRTAGSRLFAVGSLLKFARKNDVVWGTGFIDAKDTCAAGVIIEAVRGPLTRNMLLRQGLECPPVYGDPGLLLPAIFSKKVLKKYSIGIIPHYVDLARVRKDIKDSRICIIDIRSGIERVIQRARQCEILLSSSLHGCILGDAYGIPTTWIELSDGVVGGGFKFEDYFSSTDRDPVHSDCRRGIDVHSAVRIATNSAQPKIDLTALINSFPLKPTLKSKLQNFKIWPRSDSKNIQLLESEGEVEFGGETNSPLGGDTVVHTTCDSLPCTTDLSNSKIAVYGAVTENYAEYMIASLRSFMHHNKKSQFDYFILGNDFSIRTQRLIHKFGVRYLNMNLHSDFKRTTRHKYPGECFWIFKGPELFFDMGYAYSLAVDGDTLCNTPLPMDWLAQLKNIAGIDRGCSVGEFLTNIGQLSQLKSQLNIREENIQRRATNSGVLFFNNKALVKQKFYPKMVAMYKKSERAGLSRGGDDSSLALLLALNEDIHLHILDNNWNVYRGLSDATPKLNQYVKSQLFTENHASLSNEHVSDLASSKITGNDISEKDQPIVIHLSRFKPWLHHHAIPNIHVREYIDTWRKFWPNTRNQRRLTVLNRRFECTTNPRSKNSQLKANKSKVSTTRCGCSVYWYRGSQLNMGDEITPYLLSKILDCSVSEIENRKVNNPAQQHGPVLISVGSVLRLCAKNTIVWGSGIRNIDQHVNKASEFCAVRGPLTRRRLLDLGYDCPKIYGDPALLLPRFYKPKTHKKYNLGLIPHSVDFPFITHKYSGRDDILIIDVRTKGIEEIIDKIVSCQATVSSSLHGIILSVAYHIPTRWIKCSDKIMGDDTKFYDFFASLEPKILEQFDYKSVGFSDDFNGNSIYRPLMLDGGALSSEELIEATHIYPQNLDLDKLMTAFPRRPLATP